MSLAIPAASTRFNSRVYHVWNDSKIEHREMAARYRSEARDCAARGLPISGGYLHWCLMQCLRRIAHDNRKLRALCARGFC
jgi:hypothetical protein